MVTRSRVSGCAAVGVAGAPRSLSVMRRVYSAVASPALRSISDSVPTEAASESFCAPTMSTSSVTALTTDGLSVRSSAIWSIASTRTFCSTTSVRGVGLVDLARQRDVDAVARQHEAADAFDIVDADGDGLHAVAQHRRQRGALARAGDLAMPASARSARSRSARRACRSLRTSAILAKAPAGSASSRPRDFAQLRRSELVAEAQRLRRDHDRAAC